MKQAEIMVLQDPTHMRHAAMRKCLRLQGGMLGRRVAFEASYVSFQHLCSLTKPKVHWEMKVKERRSWEL